MSKTVLIQAIQFSAQFSSIWPIARILSGATTPSQTGPGSDGNEGVLHIPQISSITGTSLSDCFVSHPGHLLGGLLPLCREGFYLQISCLESLCQLMKGSDLLEEIYSANAVKHVISGKTISRILRAHDLVSFP